MKILIISGFLGAGKTSLIKTMARETGKKFAIIENEFSEFSVDGPIFESIKKGESSIEDLEIRELSEGCICCTGKVDFQSTVITVHNAISPDYLLVEPSGVAYLSMIIKNLKPIIYDKIRVLAPITIVDAIHYKESRLDYRDYFYDQLNNARTIILSKSESLCPDEFNKIKEDLGVKAKQFFPMKHYSQWTIEEWDNLFKEELIIGEGYFHNVEDEDKKTPKATMLNMTIKPLYVRSADQIIYLLEEINTGAYGDIYRVKGFTGTLRFEYVGGSYQISDFKTDEEPLAVIIGRSIKRLKLKELFDSLKIDKI